MVARPGLADPATYHGLERTLDPDSRIDMDDQGNNGQEGDIGVTHRSQPAQGDRYGLADNRLPDEESGNEQQRNAAEHDPVDQFLAGVVLAHWWQFVGTVEQHIPDLFEPLYVVATYQAVTEKTDSQHDKHRRHEQSDPGVQDTGHGGAAKQPRE